MLHWYNFLNSARQESNMLSYITMHSYAQKLISAWAVARSVFPNDPDNIGLMNEAARRVSEKMTATDFQRSTILMLPPVQTGIA